MQWCSELTAAQVPVSLAVLDWVQEALSPQNTPGTWQDGTFGFARPLFGRACFLSGLYLMICLPVVLGGAVFCGKLMTTCHIWNLRGEREREAAQKTKLRIGCIISQIHQDSSICFIINPLFCQNPRSPLNQLTIALIRGQRKAKVT